MSRIVHRKINVLAEKPSLTGMPVPMAIRLDSRRSVPVRVVDHWRVGEEWWEDVRWREGERDFYRVEAVPPHHGVYLLAFDRRTRRWVLDRVHD